MLDSFFDELEKIGRETSRSTAGSRGGKVHHYTKGGRPVYQSTIDARKKKARVQAFKDLSFMGAGAASVLGAPLLLAAMTRRPSARAYGRRYYQAGGFRPSAQAAASRAAKVIPGLKGVKTKADAKKAFKAAAMRHHPDRGGSEARMKDLNSAWEDFVKSPNYEKLAMVSWASIADKLLNSDRRQ